jgi:hypothetical protein
MAERRKTKPASAIVSARRRIRQPADAGQMLDALLRAWTATVVASALFIAALAIARVWDWTAYRQALADTLRGGPQFEQAIGELPAADPAVREMTDD